MPGSGKQTKQKAGRSKKRKNISPLCTDLPDNTQVSEPTHQTGSVHTVSANTQDINKPPDSTRQTYFNQNKRFHQLSPEYFTFENSAMNFSQQQYPGQVLQSPQGQFSAQYATQFSPGAQTLHPSSTPQWALDLMERMKSIETKVGKIEGVERTVNNISQKLNDLQTKVEGMDKRIVEVENSCVFISEKFEEHTNDLKAAKDQIRSIKQNSEGVTNSMNALEKEQAQLRDKLLEQEYRSMRDNLIFYGIPESTGASAQTEDCSALVKRFVSDQLKISAERMVLDRAHRLGGEQARRTGTARPIIAKFHYFSEREEVRMASVAAREQLKQARCGVGVQLPREWREARRSLYPVMQTERSKGNSVRFVGEKLLVNGRPYVATEK